MKATSLITSASGDYYEGGHKYYHSEGCYEARSDGKYFTHYYANLGNLYHEISKEEYEKGIAHLKAIDGKRTTHWSNAVMKLDEVTRAVDIY